MRKNIVAGLACMLLALPACTGGSGDTETTDTAAPGTTDNATTDGTETGTPTTTETGGVVCEPAPEGGVGGVMSEFGAPCTSDDECVAILGEGGVCLDNILGIYNLPCGYCSKLCELPPNTAYVPDDMTCGMGVTCIGADGYFEGCVIECQDNADCPREGYECRIMPTIGQPEDPKFCLMTDEHMVMTPPMP
ncbi:hypothetical protein [Nannocystis radixulma]|uniref:Uncharacterized protein n=1 Tax=Nannocystis radixulma TaxID=2995305 RepID=A0ABT5AYD4_9BACT|nr:hypothetical protein [Nannocystis radixulma]MDC0666851.1 hypothetical protein [Nannocystis radixulma]